MDYLRQLDVETRDGRHDRHGQRDGRVPARADAQRQRPHDPADPGGPGQRGRRSSSPRPPGSTTDDGIVVDEYGRTSRPGIWAAGDVAEFPYLALGQLMRVEGTDHAEQHGRAVGANMAGANVPYDHMPLKWFAAGELRFEGVGELSSRARSPRGLARARSRGRRLLPARRRRARRAAVQRAGPRSNGRAGSSARRGRCPRRTAPRCCVPQG